MGSISFQRDVRRIERLWTRRRLGPPWTVCKVVVAERSSLCSCLFLPSYSEGSYSITNTTFRAPFSLFLQLQRCLQPYFITQIMRFYQGVLSRVKASLTSIYVHTTHVLSLAVLQMLVAARNPISSPASRAARKGERTEALRAEGVYSRREC